MLQTETGDERDKLASTVADIVNYCSLRCDVIRTSAHCLNCALTSGERSSPPSPLSFFSFSFSPPFPCPPLSSSHFPSLTLSFPSLLPHPIVLSHPLPPLPVIQLEGPKSAVSSPSGVRGRSPATNAFWWAYVLSS